VQAYEPRLLLAATTLGASGQALNDTQLNYTIQAGLQRLLVVTVGDFNATDIQSVTFNDMSLTQGVERTNNATVDSIWYLALGTSNTATTGTIQVVSNNGNSSFIGAQAFQGVDQTTPFNSPQVNAVSGTNVGSSLTMSTDVGDLTIDLFESYDQITPGTQTPGSGQSQIHNPAGVVSGPGYSFYNTSVKVASATSTTMSWTSDDDFLIHVGGTINGASEFRVNTFTTNPQRSPSIAMDADGDYVVTWQSYGQGSFSNEIFAQRYNAAGVAQGPEVRVNTQLSNDQFAPAIAMDADGDYVITWVSNGGQDGNGYGIYAQRYNAAGVAQGSEFRVNTYTTELQQSPAIAMDAEGDFVITWESFGQDGNGYGIYAQRYNAAGAAQGSEFRVNTYATSNQESPSIAMNAGGDFIIAWESSGQDGSNFGVFAQRYNAAGIAQGSEFRVNTFTFSAQLSPSIAMDSEGDFIVAWQSYSQDGRGYGIYAQRYNAVGVAQGSEFLVNSYTTNFQQAPAIAVDADGDFVVTWESVGQDGSNEGIFAQRYNAAGVAQGSEFRVNVDTNDVQSLPAIAMDAEGDFIIAWESSGQDGDDFGVYAQRYTQFTDDASPLVTDVLANDVPLAEGDQIFSDIAALTIRFSENLSTTGGATGSGSVTNPANWTLTKDGANVSNLIQSISFGLNGATGKYEAVLTLTTSLTEGSYSLKPNGTGSITDLAGNALDGDRNGTPGGDFIRSFVQSSGPEFRVNTSTNSSQALPAVATDADGDYVVAWSSLQDGMSYDIYAQRFNAAGVAMGSEFRVNTYTSNSQFAASIAMDADGDFVITWQSFGQDGSTYGIFAQRYNAAGVAQGSEFRVNTYTTSSQRSPSIAMDADGDFIIAWESSGQDGSGYGVYAQRYNATGIAQGSEFLVNSFTTNFQQAPSIAVDADGDFVITWMSYTQDNSGHGIYAQRYNASGVAQGSEFLVNTFTAGFDVQPSIAMDADGDFVITWMNNLTEGNTTYGIFAQRYNAAGVAQGTQFLVNTYTTNAQQAPTIASDADGDFVIAWESNGQDGSNFGVYAQRYNADGVAQSSEFRVNTYTSGTQRAPGIAVDADGDFVVAWQSLGQDGSGYGIYAKRYAQFNDTAGPTVTDVLANNAPLSNGGRLASGPTTMTVRFSENLPTSGPGSVTNLANWTLTKNGANVSNQIQSISFGLNGATGKYEAVLTLTAALTEGSYSLMATAMGSITDLAGNALDGDRNGTPGGELIRDFTVRTSQATNAEFRVNSFTTGTQRSPAIAVDADGDYVVTWSSNGQDGNSYGVYAQRYNATGVAQGSEFRVNTFTTGVQRAPAIGVDADGDFVIAWMSDGQDGSGYGIYAQRYSAAGVAQGSEFRVNSFTISAQRSPAIAADADGDFVIAWESVGQDGSDYGIYAQRYNAVGVAQGSEFRVNTYTTNHQRGAAIALDADGDFVIAWQSNGQDGSNNGIYAQRYNAAGGVQGAEFKVNSTISFDQLNAAVAIDGEGNFVIAWEGVRDGSSNGIDAQRFNAAGVAQGSEIRVNTHTTNAQRNASVALDADGDFVIAWESSSQDGSNEGVYAQRYNAAGVAQGSEFRVNTYTTNTQRAPTIDMNAEGDFVIAWESLGQDGSGYGVNAQRFFTNTTPSIAGQTFSLDEASAVNTVVGTASATDPDSFSTLTYAFSGGNVNKAFNIDAATGQISVKRAFALDFETLSTFTLRVQATDQFGAFSKANVIVDLNDINDTPLISPQTLFVTPIAPNGTIVGTVMATDQDQNPLDTLTYTITGGNVGKAFAVDATTGVITLIKASALDPNTLPIYSLSIQATDNHGAFRKAVMKIHVSNQKPTIAPQTFSIDENSPINTVVGTVVASDMDAGDAFTYSITGGNVSSAFAIHAVTGQITVNNPAALDFETRPTFSLSVQVTDQSGAFRKAVITINLNNVAGRIAVSSYLEDDDLFSTAPSLLSFSL